MSYVPNATAVTEPIESRPVESAALEFRTLKEYVVDLAVQVATEDAKDLRVPEYTVNPIPTVSGRAGKVLGFDSSGQPIAVAVAGTEDPSLRADLAAFSGSSLIGYEVAGAGAVTTTVQAKLLETVSVFDFMTAAQIAAVQAGTSTDDSAAIQAAINTGKNVVFPAGSYKATNLTQSTAFQRFYAHGQVNISKNANGTLLTASGMYVEFDGIQFLGTGFAGDNVVATGDHPRFINCASYGAAGLALKATGNHVQIIGTCGIYATTDTSSSGYDIEIGVNGTATLYHQLFGVYSSQSTGGIKLIDTGSHLISGGQFGKLTIASGSSPAGVNGGMTQGARILGAVTIGQASATFVGNQFGSIAITLNSGTSGCYLVGNAYSIGATITNNGNTNNHIERELSTGAGMAMRWGDDTNQRTLTLDGLDATQGYQFDGSIVLPNTRGLKINNADGTGASNISMSSGNNLSITNNYGALQMTANGGIYQVINLPTSSAGLPSGALWRDSAAGNAVKIVP